MPREPFKSDRHAALSSRWPGDTEPPRYRVRMPIPRFPAPVPKVRKPWAMLSRWQRVFRAILAAL